MRQTLVYSYLRFSKASQALGSSIDRQTAYAERWAKEHNLQLDALLSLRDEGLSAYHQKHIKHGALGTFLRAVQDGRVPPGSVLVVEGFGRLSRATPMTVFRQLGNIMDTGITVVTASDGREYNAKKIAANPFDLMQALVIMIRANEESQTKSVRIRAALRRQCEGWIAGGWPAATIRTGCVTTRPPSASCWTRNAWRRCAA